MPLLMSFTRRRVVLGSWPCTYVQINPQESLHKSHNDAVAQVIHRIILIALITYMTESCAYSVVSHIECQTRNGLLTSLLLIHLVCVGQTINMADHIT